MRFAAELHAVPAFASLLRKLPEDGAEPSRALAKVRGA